MKPSVHDGARGATRPRAASGAGSGSDRLFESVLVANRGSIARRVFRTARSLGMRTIAVYSDADVDAAHVAEADTCVPIGGRASAESYLVGAKILRAAEVSGAEAVHPGYGFLSENADFAEACEAAGLVFIGPSADAIRSMGRKDNAKRTAAAAGVPVLVDAPIASDDQDEWVAAANRVGYPLFVKAVAGGGGKGMRLVRDPAEVADAVVAARREAQSSFGDSAVFLERCLTAARHIEIQAVGDAHGHVVHFGERECSVQRRHQKVFEEAPSPVIDDRLRGQMGAAAVGLVRHLGYVGASTVEYLYDESSGRFFFLEMNTRLQVEHAVTEQAYGIDLVRLQFEVAAGKPIDLTQNDLAPAVCAMEVRLYAEDPARDFRPTPGKVHRYVHPEGQDGLRFDDAIAEAGVISPFYDPLLAKVIATGSTRRLAAARLLRALERTRVHGPVTNREFLIALLRDPDLLSGATYTDFLLHRPALLDPRPPTPPLVHLAAAVATQLAERTSASPVGARLPPHNPRTTLHWRGPGGVDYAVCFRLVAEGDTAHLALQVNGEKHEITLRQLSATSVRVVHDGVETRCTVARYGDGAVWVDDPLGQSRWERVGRSATPATVGRADRPVAEMAGTVVAVNVGEGQTVDPGDVLLTLESMKMEHRVRSAGLATVTRVHVVAGDFVEAGTVLMSLREPGSSS